MRLNIVYATSDLFAKPALVSIKTLLMNNRGAEAIDIYYVGEGLSEGNEGMIRRLVEEYGRRVTFLPMPEECRAYPLAEKTNPICYAYFFLHELLPPDVDRALLVEGDAIVTGDLAEFYGMDLSGCYLAAADDLQSKAYRKRLGMKPGSVYFNSGIMLYNLAQWRIGGMSERTRAYLKGRKEKLFYEVQDELNVLLEGQIKLLPPRYNCTTGIFIFDYEDMKRYRRPTTCCTREEFERAKSDPVIVHFTTNQIIQQRPWVEHCVHPYNDYYMRARAQTELRDEPLWKDNRRWVNKLAFFLYDKVSKTLTATCLGIVHAYLYPAFLYRIMFR